MSPSSESSRSESTPSVPSSALGAEVQSLRLLLMGILATVLVGSLGTNLLLFKQLRLLQRSNDERAALYESATTFFNQNESKRIEEVVNKLKVFAKTNPDFAEILAKHLPPAEGAAPAK